jgi:hypothetical protein
MTMKTTSTTMNALRADAPELEASRPAGKLLAGDVTRAKAEAQPGASRLRLLPGLLGPPDARAQVSAVNAMADDTVMPVNTTSPDLVARGRAFRRQRADWVRAERPGLPVFALPGPLPARSRCLSCGARITRSRWRCDECLAAVHEIILESTR